ncbi:hypothetical protein QYE76_045210 [Lolium multiflorum]|uniref:CCHC-type domain-containing protein n=1 Tax=Lolium multiflorum TaxID=4521 RepID=A0AAD8WX98_LOLMU|nr:hypothetical protein QYE76_045210 [Lolium multiflorum]
MQDLGATFVDDHWIKRKFYNALLPYEEVKLTAIRQNASFRAMTSDEVLREVIALDISKKNAEDLVARALNTRKPNFALKMKEYGASESDEDPIEWGPDDLKVNYNEHMALTAKSFWSGNKTRSSRPRRYSSHDSTKFSFKSPREEQKGSSCYNCGNKSHFVVDCIYEKREDNGGKLIRKSKLRSLSKGSSKFSSNYDDTKIFSTKKPRAFIIREEYSSDEGDEREDKGKEGEVAAIAISTLSPFDSQNENLITNSSRCLVAKVLLELGDQDYMMEKEKHEKKEELELIYLTQAYEEEVCMRMSLEASALVLEDSNNSFISQLIKDRDYALGWVDDLKAKKLYLEESHEWSLKDVATFRKKNEGPNPCCDKLLDEVCFLRRHNTKFLKFISTQEEALEENYRLSKEKVQCCDHEEEIATLKRHKAKLVEVNDRQNESLMEYFRLSKGKETCCDHEDEIATLKRRNDKLMVIKTMYEEALMEYKRASKDYVCRNHEDDIATLERQKRSLLTMNSLQEEALLELFRVNKEKEAQEFDNTHSHPDHVHEVNRLKSKIERLQIQAQYLEGVIENRDKANAISCNEEVAAIKPKGKRRRRIKIKRSVKIEPIVKWVPTMS